jgi:hypothetical protein
MPDNGLVWKNVAQPIGLGAGILPLALGAFRHGIVLIAAPKIALY